MEKEQEEVEATDVSFEYVVVDLSLLLLLLPVKVVVRDGGHVTVLLLPHPPVLSAWWWGVSAAFLSKNPLQVQQKVHPVLLHRQQQMENQCSSSLNHQNYRQFLRLQLPCLRYLPVPHPLPHLSLQQSHQDHSLLVHQS